MGTDDQNTENRDEPRSAINPDLRFGSDIVGKIQNISDMFNLDVSNITGLPTISLTYDTVTKMLEETYGEVPEGFYDLLKQPFENWTTDQKQNAYGILEHSIAARHPDFWRALPRDEDGNVPERLLERLAQGAQRAIDYTNTSYPLGASDPIYLKDRRNYSPGPRYRVACISTSVPGEEAKSAMEWRISTYTDQDIRFPGTEQDAFIGVLAEEFEHCSQGPLQEALRDPNLGIFSYRTYREYDAMFGTTEIFDQMGRSELSDFTTGYWTVRQLMANLYVACDHNIDPAASGRVYQRGQYALMEKEGTFSLPAAETIKRSTTNLSYNLLYSDLLPDSPESQDPSYIIPGIAEFGLPKAEHIMTLFQKHLADPDSDLTQEQQGIMHRFIEGAQMIGITPVTPAELDAYQSGLHAYLQENKPRLFLSHASEVLESDIGDYLYALEHQNQGSDPGYVDRIKQVLQNLRNIADVLGVSDRVASTLKTEEQREVWHSLAPDTPQPDPAYQP